MNRLRYDELLGRLLEGDWAGAPSPFVEINLPWRFGDEPSPPRFMGSLHPHSRTHWGHEPQEYCDAFSGRRIITANPPRALSRAVLFRAFSRAFGISR